MGASVNGINPGRLSEEQCKHNFGDLHELLDNHEAQIAAERCYFCYDAPCVTACPTQIDIPLFIRQIANDNALGAAHTIFKQNILGGMCARVCPTETLCEEACVRETAETKPVKIGELQRFATDAAMAQNRQFFERAELTRKSVAIIGAGPAGLACAHRLAMHGHSVKIFEARKKPGGLNEFGIAAYKTVDNFANREVEYITSIGGIEIEHGKSLGKELTLDVLVSDYDAVFIGAGLGDVNDLGIDGEQLIGVEDAVDFIARLRQTSDLSDIPVGRRVVVIGGGMTAIDAAIQSKLLGAEEVTICYRRGQDNMNASDFEQELATSRGVTIRHWLQPKSIGGNDGQASEIVFEYTNHTETGLTATGETLTLAADQIFTAIGQKLERESLSSSGLKIEDGRIAVDEHGRTNNPKIWAGGDCTITGEDLTVTAVAQGRDAAESIHLILQGGDK